MFVVNLQSDAEHNEQQLYKSIVTSNIYRQLAMVAKQLLLRTLANLAIILHSSYHCRLFSIHALFVCLFISVCVCVCYAGLHMCASYIQLASYFAHDYEISSLVVYTDLGSKAFLFHTLQIPSRDSIYQLPIKVQYVTIYLASQQADSFTAAVQLYTYTVKLL